MKSKSIDRKHLRLRASIIRKISKTVRRMPQNNGILPSHVVIDSATEIHLRHVSGVYLNPKHVLMAVVFDNYDESTNTYQADELATETLLAILKSL